MRIAFLLKIPIFGVITKTDMANKNILTETIVFAKNLFKQANCIPMVVKTQEDLITTIKNFGKTKIVPIFLISNVTGEGIDDLRLFLNIVKNPISYKPEEAFHLNIDHTFQVDGVGTVISGIVISGKYKLGDKLMLGPNSIGEWTNISARSIHFNRTLVSECQAGQSICFAIPKIKRKDIKKGMVVVDPSIAKSVYRFKAEVTIIHHHTTITDKFQAVIHCKNVSQSCKIVEMDNPVIRSGDNANIIFEFMYKPEFVIVGSSLIFREGKTRGIGKIVEVY